jgi:hypothetical protein
MQKTASYSFAFIAHGINVVKVKLWINVVFYVLAQKDTSELDMSKRG